MVKVRICTQRSTTVRPLANYGSCRAFRATNEPRYQQAFLKGLSHILEAQISEWRVATVLSTQQNYHRHITFNDNAMVRILELLRDVSESPD